MMIIKIMIVLLVVEANTLYQVLWEALYQQADTIIIPILLVRKPKSREVKGFAQDHLYKNRCSTEQW